MFIQATVIFTFIYASLGNLKVLSPKELRDQFTINGIPYSLGNYGYVPYGSKLSALIQLSNPLIGCEQKTPNITDMNDSILYSGSRALLVERGNCSFGQKTMEAERIGYQLLIVVDDQNEAINGVEMVDRNRSHVVNIPSVMISQKDGNTLITFLKNNPSTDVFISIDFPKPNVSSIVQYQYWMGAYDRDSYLFVEQWKPFHESMQNYLNFTPHYPLWYCSYCKDLNWTVKNSDCLSGGRYCAFDPDNDGPLTGKDVVWQTLRQLCIYETQPLYWWAYMVEFGKQCVGAGSINSTKIVTRDPEQCSEKVMSQIKIDSEKVKVCMMQSFNENSQNIDQQLQDSKILAKERQVQLNTGIQSYPILVVNDQQFRGTLALPYYQVQQSQTQIFDTAHYGPLQMICEGFKQQTIPTLCQERLKMYIDEKGNLKVQNEGVKAWIIWLCSIIGLLIVMGSCIYLYRRQMRKAMQKELQLQVNMAISQYFSLNEKEKNFVELR